MVDDIMRGATWLMRQRNPQAVIAMYADLLTDSTAAMLAAGYEEIETSAAMLDDGRPVIFAAGRSWVLNSADFEALRAGALQRAISNGTQNSQKICPALIDGQLCGGVLSATPVCPRCALGKQGVAQIMTCDVCGAQTAVMR